jgi:hypothetical protein
MKYAIRPGDAAFMKAPGGRDAGTAAWRLAISLVIGSASRKLTGAMQGGRDTFSEPTLFAKAGNGRRSSCTGGANSPPNPFHRSTT